MRVTWIGRLRPRQGILGGQAHGVGLGFVGKQAGGSIVEEFDVPGGQRIEQGARPAALSCEKGVSRLVLPKLQADDLVIHLAPLGNEAGTRGFTAASARTASNRVMACV